MRSARFTTKESYRIDEIADLWRVNERTVRRRIERGELIAIRIGSTLRIRQDDLRRYEEENSTCKAKAS